MMKYRFSRFSAMILLATVSLLVVSCYRITLVNQDHEAVTRGKISRKVVRKGLWAIE